MLSNGFTDDKVKQRPTRKTGEEKDRLINKFKITTVVLLLKLLHSLRTPCYKKILNKQLYLTSDVFDPIWTITGKLMAENLVVRDEDKVLDLGTGSGFLAVVAADKAEKVIATDINPDAMRIARINADLNGLKEKIEVRKGDLFEPVKDEKFDFIIFNPPYLPGKPKYLQDHAWFDEEQKVIKRFFRLAKEHLNPEGIIQISYSTLGYVSRLEQIIDSFGFKFRIIAKKQTPMEIIYIYQITC